MPFEDRNAAMMTSDSQTVLEPYEISTEVKRLLDMDAPDMKVEISTRFDEASKQLVMGLRAWLTAEKHEPQFETYYFPKNAWQCFVNDYAPASYIKMFPVKYTELKVRVRGDVYVCPHHTIPWATEVIPHLEFIHGFANDSS